jgi:WD repeat-containing protein 26
LFLIVLLAHAFIAGDIHIWDRESGALLHHVRAQVVGGDMTSIAWNQAADPFMFATGSHDGAVRIWTSTPGSQQASPYPEVHILTPPTETRTRSPSPLPPDSEYRTENPGTFLRSDLKSGSIRDNLAELPFHQSSVSFQPSVILES